MQHPPERALGDRAGSLADNPEQRAEQPCCHLITSEFPPQSGGVSDYTNLLAAGLAERGDEVHVWCPGRQGTSPSETGPSETGIVVHRQFGTFSPADLQRVGAELDAFTGPRRLLVQWVPHGYGYRSMNVGFCQWLLKRAKQHGDRIELMVHEPFLSFDWASPRQSAAALVHRWMTIILLRAASRVWVSIPGWERSMRGYALGRKVAFEWLPIFSNIPTASDPARTQAIRRQYADGNRLLIGHFGTFGSLIAGLLDPILLALASDPVDQTILLMGKRSDQYLRELIQKEPRLEGVIRATGTLSADELSHHLSACDLLIQPYPDGVSTRRGSFMAGLANGKPIVTTTGWLSEPLWAQSDAVALAPAGDTAAFLEQTRRLRGDARERQRVGSAAGRLYRERFDISQTISSLRRAEPTKDRECVFS
jgi:glycosyltransferase involved in cell wall biosynthesis